MLPRHAYVLSLLILASVVSDSAVTKAASDFDVQKISEGVYAVIRRELPGLTVNGNSILIINEDKQMACALNKSAAGPCVSRS